MTETGAGTPSSDLGELRPPATGEPKIDVALGRLPELTELPVDQNYDRLSQAHAVLDEVLHADADEVLQRDGTDVS